MRIEEITLQYVGPFENQTIQFQPIPNTEKKAEIHIFTGANGSGKSTILHALASGFIHKGGRNIDNKIEKRFHKNKDILITLKNNINEKFLLNSEASLPPIQTYEGKGFTNKYSFINYKNLQVPNNREIKKNLNFACFAYSGYRDFSYQPIETIKELNINLLYESLVFNKKIKNQVNQWLANMIAKEAIAHYNNEIRKGKIYRENIVSLETVIQKLLNQEVKFELETNPTNIVLRKNQTLLDFDVLPDGLKSIISWIGDLLMRLDKLPWKDDTPILKRNIILFLDEIEVHLHPKWQMKILPIVQELFPNAQIFISTHSPFVVNSVDDAWIYKLTLDEQGVSTCQKPILSETGKSYSYILDEIFDVDENLGLETERMLDAFYAERDKILEGKTVDEQRFKHLIIKLIQEGIEVQQIVGHELRQIKRITNKEFGQT